MLMVMSNLREYFKRTNVGVTLRNAIRKSVMEQSKLLDSIGTAQMERIANFRISYCQKNIG
jgi:hypothetical protein